MRSQTAYPATVDLEIFETIKNFWEKGIFDDYSEQHFIIRAINNDVSYHKQRLFLLLPLVVVALAQAHQYH